MEKIRVHKPPIPNPNQADRKKGIPKLLVPGIATGIALLAACDAPEVGMIESAPNADILFSGEVKNLTPQQLQELINIRNSFNTQAQNGQIVSLSLDDSVQNISATPQQIMASALSNQETGFVVSPNQINVLPESAVPLMITIGDSKLPMVAQTLEVQEAGKEKPTQMLFYYTYLNGKWRQTGFINKAPVFNQDGTILINYDAALNMDPNSPQSNFGFVIASDSDPKLNSLITVRNINGQKMLVQTNSDGSLKTGTFPSNGLFESLETSPESPDFVSFKINPQITKTPNLDLPATALPTTLPTFTPTLPPPTEAAPPQLETDPRKSLTVVEIPNDAFKETVNDPNLNNIKAKLQESFTPELGNTITLTENGIYKIENINGLVLAGQRIVNSDGSVVLVITSAKRAVNMATATHTNSKEGFVTFPNLGDDERNGQIVDTFKIAKNIWDGEVDLNADFTKVTPDKDVETFIHIQATPDEKNQLIEAINPNLLTNFKKLPNSENKPSFTISINGYQTEISRIFISPSDKNTLFSYMITDAWNPEDIAAGLASEPSTYVFPNATFAIEGLFPSLRALLQERAQLNGVQTDPTNPLPDTWMKLMNVYPPFAQLYSLRSLPGNMNPLEMNYYASQYSAVEVAEIQPTE